MGFEGDVVAGSRIGRWALTEYLGRGGFAHVWAGHHVLIEELPVAIKILFEEHARKDSVRKRFVNDARAASRAGHENIVQVLDAGDGSDGGPCYIAMELLRGPSLDRILAGGPIGVMRTVKIGMQVARALQAAHERSIIHRDLKPDNIHVEQRQAEPEFVKVLDFGVAQLRYEVEGDGQRLTRAGEIIGTFSHMSPEQWLGEEKLDGRADIYALGVILFQCVAGRLPFHGKTAAGELALAHIQAPVPDLVRDVHVSGTGIRELNQLIQKMMAKERADRPRTMRDVALALEKVLDAVLATERIAVTSLESLDDSTRALLGAPSAGEPPPAPGPPATVPMAILPDAVAAVGELPSGGEEELGRSALGAAAPRRWPLYAGVVTAVCTLAVLVAGRASGPAPIARPAPPRDLAFGIDASAPDAARPAPATPPSEIAVAPPVASHHTAHPRSEAHVAPTASDPEQPRVSSVAAAAPPATGLRAHHDDPAGDEAVRAFAARDYARASELARQEIAAGHRRGWRIYGASACFLRDPVGAKKAWNELPQRGRQYVTQTCQRNGVKLP